MNCLRPILAAALAASLLAQPAYGKDEPVVLEPNGEWTLESDEESCALLRDFADGEGVVRLTLRQFSPGGSLRVEVVANGRPTTLRDHLSYRFDPSPDWRNVNKIAFGYFSVPRKFDGVVFDASIVPWVEGEPPLNRVLPGDPRTLERLRAALNTIDGLSVSDAFGDELTLRTGSLMQPFAEMRRCLDGVMEKWGLDPLVQSRLTRLPRSLNMGEIVPAFQASYQAMGLSQGWPASFQVTLLVDSTGVTTECRVHEQFMGEAFQLATCEQFRNAKFEPALDDKRQPVTSYFTTRVYHRAS